MTNITSVSEANLGIVGFDAGDQSRSTIILGRNANRFNIEDVNIYRIDGNSYNRAWELG